MKEEQPGKSEHNEHKTQASARRRHLTIPRKVGDTLDMTEPEPPVAEHYVSLSMLPLECSRSF